MPQHNTHFRVGRRTGLYTWACVTLKRIFTSDKLTDQLLPFGSGQFTEETVTNVYIVSGFQYILDEYLTKMWTG